MGKGILVVLSLVLLTSICYADSPVRHREASPVVIEAIGTIDDTASGASFFPSTGNSYFLMSATISASDNVEIEISASNPALLNPSAIAKASLLASDPIVLHAGGYPVYVTKSDEGFTVTSDTGSSIAVTLFGFEYRQ